MYIALVKLFPFSCLKCRELHHFNSFRVEGPDISLYIWIYSGFHIFCGIRVILFDCIPLKLEIFHIFIYTGLSCNAILLSPITFIRWRYLIALFCWTFGLSFVIVDLLPCVYGYFYLKLFYFPAMIIFWNTFLFG